MSTALEAASLIMIPTSYSDGLLASVKPNDGAGDFTFTRGSNISATRVNADGNIEKGYENLLTYSNNFSQWTKAATTATSGQSGYDGSSDAWLIEKSNPNGVIYKSLSSISVGTISVYAKASASNWMAIYTGTSLMFFNLANGVLGGGSGEIDYKIEAVSGATGWYRCSVVDTSITSFSIYPAEGDGDRSGTSGSILLQDAMLNQGLVAYPYVETTTAPVAAGILEDMPRIDFSGGNQSLLLEPSRTNETPHSEYYDVFLNYGTGKCTFTPNAAISPEGFQNSFKAVLNSNQQNGGGAISTRMRRFTQGAIITFSMFFKADEFDQVILGGFFQNESATFNLKDGSVVSQASNVIDAYSIPFGNGWYRCVVTYTFQDGIGNGYLYSGFRVVAISDGVSSVGDGVKGLFAYGVQFEEATYPTSYIPTYGVSQTRLADVCNDAGDASTFNSTEGVLYAEVAALDSELTYKEISLSDGTSSNRIEIRYLQNKIEFTARISGVAEVYANFTPTSVFDFNKIALRYNGTNFKLYVNGSLEASETSVNTFSANTLNSAQFNSGAGASVFYGNAKQVLVFPTALSDDACITLTTI